jgi:hypothetical protein
LSKNPLKISYLSKVLGKTEDVPSAENTLTPYDDASKERIDPSEDPQNGGGGNTED